MCSAREPPPRYHGVHAPVAVPAPRAEQTAAAAANAKWIVSHKPTCVIGDPMAHYITVNLNSNIISFQARISANDGASFNSSLDSYLIGGTLIFTFEYESLKAV